jgi:hypothetical protein
VTHVVDTGARRRDASLDTLRTLLVAWIIGGHALLGYAAVGGWGYDEVNEVTLNPRVELTLAAILGPSALFLMGTFFLIAGLFTPVSVDRKGAGLFARERFLRLGVPFLVSAFAIWPMSMWVAYRSTGERVSYQFLLTGRERLIDSGSLWFAEVLLIFSLVYVVWRSWSPLRPGQSSPFTLGRMGALAAGVALTTFLVRQFLSARGTQYLDLHLWQWPQLAAMFGLGVVGARHGLAHAVPPRLARTSGWITLVIVLCGPVVALVFGVDDLANDAAPFLSGWNVEALVLACFEGILVVFGSLWMLAFAQRHLTSNRPLWHRLRRSSFAAFILQIVFRYLLNLPIGWTHEISVLLWLWLGWRIIRTRYGRYYRLIKAFYDLTKCPVIVNTSFNVRGEPIVCTPADAFRCFMGTDIDALVLEDFLVEKDAQPERLLEDRQAYHSRFALD